MNFRKQDGSSFIEVLVSMLLVSLVAILSLQTIRTCYQITKKIDQRIEQQILFLEASQGFRLELTR